MNTEQLTTPSPEMKQHAQDLKNHAKEGVDNIRKDATNLAQDAKDHASRGIDAVKQEATTRISNAKGKASDLLSSVKDYAVQNPLHAFGFGVLVGLFLARRRH
jgi:ElaB/YqjD/DUF883 family membrane-anchored ribosome-binding protein